MSLTMPILSTPVMLILARNDTSLCIAHLTAIILLPSFDIILIATGHLGLWIIIEPSGERYPKTSSPGIGLQHLAISYDCSAFSTFSLRRKGEDGSVLPSFSSSSSFFSFREPRSFSSQYFITFFEGLLRIIFLRLSRLTVPSSIPE